MLKQSNAENGKWSSEINSTRSDLVSAAFTCNKLVAAMRGLSQSPNGSWTLRTNSTGSSVNNLMIQNTKQATISKGSSSSSSTSSIK